MPVNKKVLIRFKSVDTELKKDYVTVSDPKTQTLITVLTGINRDEMIYASSSNEMEIKFISDNDRESIGFEATYEQVCKYWTCFEAHHTQAMQRPASVCKTSQSTNHAYATNTVKRESTEWPNNHMRVNQQK